ncbi:MAG: DMT family transporter [Nitrospinae bacterium]|nr:DMT family transporter [Nitrospinota bacterium]
MGNWIVDAPPEFRALLGALLFACNQILVRRLLERASALTIIFWVNGWMAVLAIVFSPLSDSYEGDWTTALVFYVITGVTGNLVARYSALRSSENVGVSRTNALVAATPIGSALMGVVILGERPDVGVWLGILLIVLGMIWLTGERLSGEYSLRRYTFAFIAMAAFSVTPYLRKAGLAAMNAPWLGIIVATLIANVGLLMSSRFASQEQKFQWSMRVAAACVPAGLFGLFSAVLFWTSLRDGQLAVISPLVRMTPIFVLLLSVVLLRDLEVITKRLVVGTLIVVAGAVLVTSGG